jgi:hypothetical protein
VLDHLHQDGRVQACDAVILVGHARLEQADALIDQDPSISEQIGWWNRQGAEVIRGHTSTLIIGREVLYIEPLFIRSRQNPTTQLKRVSVVFRGYVHQAATLEQALRLHQHSNGTLVGLGKYLHQRTGGMIGSLSHLIRAAAIAAILQQTEAITLDLLEGIDIDYIAEGNRHRI